MILVVGLGNPGSEYLDTRHNIGFRVLDMVAIRYKFENWKYKLNGYYSVGTIGQKKCILLKPQTFMNLSGSCVKSFINYFKLERDKIFVVHDDIDLELGKSKTKFGGGHAGHNGVRSLHENLQTSDFFKIRIGVGRPDQTDKVAKYVLSRFQKKEIELVDKNLAMTVEDLEKIVQLNRLSL